MDFSTAELVDAHGPALRSCEVQFRHYGARARFHGPVRTVKTFEDNALIRQVLSTPAAGRCWSSTAAARCAVPWWGT